MPVIDVDGDKLHYVDQGDGPLVLLVHGSCGGSGQWKRFMSRLGTGWRLVALDMLGCGASSPMPLDRVWTSGDDTRSIGALMDHLDAPFHFVGHSAGCLFSWKALQARAGQIRSMTLFEPVFFDLLRETEDPLQDWIWHMADGYRGRVDAGDLEGALNFFIDEWAGERGAWAATPDPVKEMIRKGGGRLYHEWGERLSLPLGVTNADLPLPPASALLIEGSETPKAVKRVMDLFAAARTGMCRATIDGAGHMSPFTHVDLAVDLTLRHLRDAT